MRTPMAQQAKKTGTLFSLLILTGFFILLEISFFIQTNKTYFIDFGFVAEKINFSAAMLNDIYFFIFAQLLVHMVFCLWIWGVSSLISLFFHFSGNKKIFTALGIWLIGIVTVLLTNQYYFPNSKFAELSSVFFPDPTFVKNFLFVLVMIWNGLLIIALLQLARLLITTQLYFLVFALILITEFWPSSPITSANLDAATESQPNIILIGVDSLRPDFLSYFGHDQMTPFFDRFLEQSLVFTEAVTPLARTFPSWSSILTGEYPRQNGIRSNLVSQQGLDFQNSLPAILERHGYETIFATDETRFSNIDKNFGFNEIISPPMGINDFLLGTFNDFPLSNLIVNTVIGKWLFPYSYANRPVYFTYEPQTFLNLILQKLKNQRTKPLFLAVHFCLPHYPYLWSGLSGNHLTGLERYEASINKIDTILGSFLFGLKDNHVLDHAILVLLSDHGEAFELSGDRLTENELFLSGTNHTTTDILQTVPQFYPPSLDHEEVNQSAGHGTDVLGLSQYHSLLAFRFYGLSMNQKGPITGVVSLIDIKPTLLELLKIEYPLSDGISLVSLINGDEEFVYHAQHIFLESDFSPEAIRTIHPETRKIMLEGIELYRVDPKTIRLTVKDRMYQMIIDSKQYADIYGDWMLALYPTTQKRRTPILMNLRTGQWTNNLQSEFAYNSPALSMLQALQAFYGAEIGPVEMTQLYTKWDPDALISVN